MGKIAMPALRGGKILRLIDMDAALEKIGSADITPGARSAMRSLINSCGEYRVPEDRFNRFMDGESEVSAGSLEADGEVNDIYETADTLVEELMCAVGGTVNIYDKARSASVILELLRFRYNMLRDMNGKN